MVLKAYAFPPATGSHDTRRRIFNVRQQARRCSNPDSTSVRIKTLCRQCQQRWRVYRRCTGELFSLKHRRMAEGAMRRTAISSTLFEQAAPRIEGHLLGLSVEVQALDLQALNLLQTSIPNPSCPQARITPDKPQTPLTIKSLCRI